jgi:hypothetical protein
MKNNHLNYKTLSVLLIAGLSFGISCKKLDEKPLSFVTPDKFYTTSSQIEATFAGTMNRLWNYWGEGPWQGSYEGYSYGLRHFVNDDQLLGGDLIIPADHANVLWRPHYNAILNLNSAILAMKNGNLKGVSGVDLDKLVGQAKFLRGYNYFMLVRMFGDLPLITEDLADPVNAQIARSPVADVYKLIVSDLTEAAAKLPATWPSEQKGRPTSGVAKGLLAKAYLTMATAPLNDVSNYPKAADLAKQVMEEGVYSLVPDVKDVFSVATKYGPEMMWSFNSNYQDIATDPQIYSPGLLGGWGDAGVETEWEQKYPASPRKDAYLLTDIDGVHYDKWVGENHPFVKKFMYDKQEDFDNYRSIVNIPILRFADVLLIFAEADNMANNGPTPAAVEAINKVIDRANGNKANTQHPRLTTGMTKEAFDMAVIEERNQELCFEYDRWFDLIRKRILKEKNPITVQQNFSDADYLFPIPEHDMRLNPLLTQNPGY